jgi:hypothetical protein
MVGGVFLQGKHPLESRRDGSSSIKKERKAAKERARARSRK